eukprot:GHVU01024381.1.p1 GENE.GHVU01024381.1~~GHVU01024381.1.p1  ORF type:complete len:102 (+),score=7.11 GHVU01024381.1:176-481(+)
MLAMGAPHGTGRTTAKMLGISLTVDLLDPEIAVLGARIAGSLREATDGSGLDSWHEFHATYLKPYSGYSRQALANGQAKKKKRGKTQENKSEKRRVASLYM